MPDFDAFRNPGTNSSSADNFRLKIDTSWLNAKADKTPQTQKLESEPASTPKGQSREQLGSPNLSADNLRDCFLKHFHNIDSDKSGEASQTELANYIKRMPLSHEDKVPLKQVCKEYDTMNKMTAKQMLLIRLDIFEELSPADAVQFAAYNKTIKAERQQVDRALDYLNKNFEIIDRNRDGFLSANELHKSGQMHNFGHVVSQFKSVQNTYNDEWGSEDDGISRKDLAYYVRSTWEEGCEFYTDSAEVETSRSSVRRLNESRPKKRDILRAAD